MQPLILRSKKVYIPPHESEPKNDNIHIFYNTESNIKLLLQTKFEIIK